MSTLNSQLQLSILNQKKSKNLAEKGFTLIELLITVVILGVLSAVAVPGFLSQKDKADIAAANAQGKALMTACKTAILDGVNVPGNINVPDPGKNFGKVNWQASVTQGANAGPTACSSATTGSGTAQSYVLNMTTGEMTTETDAA